MLVGNWEPRPEQNDGLRSTLTTGNGYKHQKLQKTWAPSFGQRTPSGCVCPFVSLDTSRSREMCLEVLHPPVTADALAQDGNLDGRDQQLLALLVVPGGMDAVCCVEFIEVYWSTSGQRRMK